MVKSVSRIFVLIKSAFIFEGTKTLHNKPALEKTEIITDSMNAKRDFIFLLRVVLLSFKSR